MNSSFSAHSKLIQCRTLKKMFQGGIIYGDNPLHFSFPRLLLQIPSIVFLTRFIHFLLRPLKQPRVVAEIAVGIIIGPSVLGRSEKFANLMFPENGSIEYQTLAIIGMVYFIFIMGVKMDITVVANAERKVIFTGICGMLLPFGAVALTSWLLRNHLDKRIASIPAIVGLGSSMSITAFMVIYLILKEFNLLNSDVGRLALSTSMVSDFACWTAVIIFQALMQATVNISSALKYLISLFGLLGLMILVLRPAAIWIISRTPVGKPVSQLYVIIILLAVLVLAFVSDFLGATVVDGPLILGLVIPDGPPLGAILADRTEPIVELLMPLLFAFMGQRVDIFSLKDWSSWVAVFLVFIVGYMGKLLGTLLPSLSSNMPFRDALTLALIMSLRGQVEIFTYMHWLDYGILTPTTFTLAILSITMVTAIATPIITILERPTVSYRTVKRRLTIEHMPPNTEFHVVVCIYEQESVPALVKLLEASNATKYSPIFVYALHLIELTGRTTPIFISHNKRRLNNSRYARSSNPIVKAFKNYEKNTGENVFVQAFTVVSPYNTMYRDIAKLALENNASLVIMPFYMNYIEGEYDHKGGATYKAKRMVNSAVQAHVPCSMGIFVDRGRHRNFMSRSLYVSIYHVALLFLGGADSREALAFADRMLGKADSLSLKVLRFLSNETNPEEEEEEEEDQWEKQLDDQVVEMFIMKNMRNDSIMFREVVVKDGSETVSAIRKMNDKTFDLWIVGRQKVMNQTLIKGISEWSENPELGVIGDFLSSPNFEGTASVLVVQQQVLPGDRHHEPVLVDRTADHLEQDIVNNSN